MKFKVKLSNRETDNSISNSYYKQENYNKIEYIIIVARVQISHHLTGITKHVYSNFELLFFWGRGVRRKIRQYFLFIIYLNAYTGK